MIYGKRMLRSSGRALIWLRRYLPSELAGTLNAVVCGWLAGMLTGSPALAAIAGTWGETLAYYSIMLIRELRGRGGPGQLPQILRDLLLEFGPAEMLDSLLLRPGLLYAGIILSPHMVIGLLGGKLAADLIFYLPTIMSYELLSRLRRDLD